MHPNSIANLRAPWRPGERPPSPGPSKVERALKITQDATPKAARLIAQTVGDPEAPLGLRLRCAEYILDKALPTQKAASMVLESGAEWLELRFVSPGGQEVRSDRAVTIEAEASVINDLEEPTSGNTEDVRKSRGEESEE